MRNMVDVERPGTTDEEPKTKKLLGFFSDPEGNLRRGIATFTSDEEGNEIPIFREHNTGTMFPRVVPKEKPQSGDTEKPSV